MIYNRFIQRLMLVFIWIGMVITVIPLIIGFFDAIANTDKCIFQQLIEMWNPHYH